MSSSPATTPATTTKAKKLKINLDQVINPNPKLVKAYKDNDAMHLWYPVSIRPEYGNEEAIFEYSKSSEAPVTHKITGIYRQKVEEKKKEYCFFHENLRTLDFFKNRREHTRLVGKYQIPTFHRINTSTYSKDGYTGPQPQDPSIDEVTTIYEYEFDDIKPLLEEWYGNGIMNDQTQYYVVAGSRKYSKPYTFEEFINSSFDDLVTLGKYGTLQPQIIGAMLQHKQFQYSPSEWLKEQKEKAIK